MNKKKKELITNEQYQELLDMITELRFELWQLKNLSKFKEGDIVILDYHESGIGKDEYKIFGFKGTIKKSVFSDDCKSFELKWFNIYCATLISDSEITKKCIELIDGFYYIIKKQEKQKGIL